MLLRFISLLPELFTYHISVTKSRIFKTINVRLLFFYIILLYLFLNTLLESKLHNSFHDTQNFI